MLAFDTCGHIYYRLQNSIGVYDQDWNKVGHVSGPPMENANGNCKWVLGADGLPEFSRICHHTRACQIEPFRQVSLCFRPRSG